MRSMEIHGRHVNGSHELLHPGCTCPPLILRYLSDTNNDKAKPVKSRFITRRSVTKKRKRQTTLEETTLTFKESDRMTMSEVEYEDAMTMTMGFEDDEGDNTEQVCSTPPPHRVL